MAQECRVGSGVGFLCHKGTHKAGAALGLSWKLNIGIDFRPIIFNFQINNNYL
jgi:hypothetical protein